MGECTLKRIALLFLAVLLPLSSVAIADDLALVDEIVPLINSDTEGSDLSVDLPEELNGFEIEADVSALVDEAASTDIALPGAVSNEAVGDEAEDEAVSAWPSELVLGVSEKYALDASAFGGTLTFKSSKSSVASVSRKGVIKARKKGSATIKCYKGKKKVASCSLKVVAAPKKVTLSASKMIIGVRETVQLTPSIPKGSHASFTWSSSKKSVVSVSASGVIRGKRAGKARITVKTQNGKSCSVTVYVKKAPYEVSLSKTSKVLAVGSSLQLKASLPSGTASYALEWLSSDEQIASVSASGKVKAAGTGKTVITVRTYNGVEASCVITVRRKHRALLIGQEGFSPICRRNRRDVVQMASMLKSVKGYDGIRFDVTQRFDLSRSEAINAIREVFAGASEEDVSLFFIATHGDVDSTGKYAGALAMVGGMGEEMLLMQDLADALLAVPGRVIVIIESCGAGAAIYADGEISANVSERTKAMAQAAAKAFARVDPGIVVSKEGTTGENQNGLRTNTGELMVTNKFYVLAASAYQEQSYGMEIGEDSSYNFFTKWLLDGVGTSIDMPADVDANRRITLHELYSYISEVGDDNCLGYDDIWGALYQHVQVYPSKSKFVLF